jgi:hypothetical protein
MKPKEYRNLSNSPISKTVNVQKSSVAFEGMRTIAESRATDHDSRYGGSLKSASRDVLEDSVKDPQ